LIIIIITKVTKGHFFDFFCLFTLCTTFARGFGPSLPVLPGHTQGWELVFPRL